MRQTSFGQSVAEHRSRVERFRTVRFELAVPDVPRLPIERAVDRDDRRARACRLTPAGETMLGAMEQAARQAHRDTLAGLASKERKIFIALMHRILTQADDAAGTSED